MPARRAALRLALARFGNFILASELRIAAAALALVALVVVTVSWASYADGQFRSGLLAEAHGTLLDILVIGVFILWLNRLRDRRERARRYHEEIDDFREWHSHEAAHRVSGNIRRLNAMGVFKIALSRCYLRKMDLRGVRLAGSAMHRVDLGEARLRGADFSGCNLDTAFLGHADLRGTRMAGANLIRARLVGAKANGISLQGANLVRADMRHASLRSADLRCSDLGETGFVGVDLAGADLRGAQHLAAEALLQVKSLAYARLDPPLEARIRELAPALLVGPRHAQLQETTREQGHGTGSG